MGPRPSWPSPGLDAGPYSLYYLYVGTWSGGEFWVLLRPTSEIIPPRHQRSPFAPVIGTGCTLCSFCSYLNNNPGPCILGCWNGLPLAQRLLPRILSDTFYSSLKTLLFSRARVGSASE